MSSYGQSPKSQFLRTSSMNSISQTEENATKNSLLNDLPKEVHCSTTGDGMMMLVELASKSAGSIRLKTGWKITNEKFQKKYKSSLSSTGNLSSTNTVRDNTASIDSTSQTGENATKNSLSDTSQNFAPTGNYHVYGKDITLEQGTFPENFAPLPEKVAPVQQKKLAPLREDLQERKTDTVKERNAAKLENYKVELQNVETFREAAHQAYNKQIAKLQSEYDAKKNKTTQTANDLLMSIERQKRLRDNTDAMYEKRISDLKSKIEKMQTKEFKTAEQRQTKQEEVE